MSTLVITATLLTTLGVVWLWLRLPVSASPISVLINGLSGFVFRYAHTGRPTPAAEIDPNPRYAGTRPPPNTANRHGEIEYIAGDVAVTHWFEQARESVYHFVTAGDPANEAFVIIPGLPETWWAFHNQIADLSADYYMVVIDVKGYGQSDKRLELDYTNETMAKEIAALLDKLGIRVFNLAGHDRGAVLTDHMTNVASLRGRILRYIRMQQSFNEPHGHPKPPHFLMKTKFGEALFQSRNFLSVIYRAWFPSNLSESTLSRLTYEFRFKGTAAALRKYFETTNFEIELEDRHRELFKSMTMPMLILQGWYDRGQHPEEYAHAADVVPQCRVQFIHANHFFHLEDPPATNRAIRNFLAETRQLRLIEPTENISIDDAPLENVMAQQEAHHGHE